MNLTVEQIEENWEEFMSHITAYLPDQKDENNRWWKLWQFFDKNADRIAIAPASTKMIYHSPFPGGYVYHVNNVIKSVKLSKELWIKMGVELDFTDEEMIFSALNHDLGKTFDNEEDYYIENKSEWHKNNLGVLYNVSNIIPYMKVQDRSLFILQSLGIQMTRNEFLAISTHDGLYDDGNKPYFSFSTGMKCTLPYLLHSSDFLSAFVENQSQNKGEIINTNKLVRPVPPPIKMIREGENPNKTKKSNSGALNKFFNE